MRLVLSALCAMLISALCVLGIRWAQVSSGRDDNGLAVLKGKVAMPGPRCQGASRSSTFTLLIDVAGTYRSYRFACNEVVRAAAVGGTEVVFRVKAVTYGNQDALLIRMAKVDGRDLWEPKTFSAPPSEGEIIFFALVSGFLFLVVGVIATSGEERRHAASIANRRRTLRRNWG